MFAEEQNLCHALMCQCTKMWILQEVIFYECTSSQLRVGLLLHPEVLTRYAQLTRGAFIINDFLQNPHFSFFNHLLNSYFHWLDSSIEDVYRV